MPTCPRCHETVRQNRAGATVAGSQRYECMYCGCKYTPEPKPRGYDCELRKKAIQFYVDGMNLRRIGRHLGIHHRTVSLWVKAYAREISAVPVPDEVVVAELDELFTFIGDKKTKSMLPPR
jgi:transposase-like protein